MNNFESINTTSQTNEILPRNMDALLDQLNDLDENDSNFLEERQAILKKLQELKEDNEAATEAALEEAQLRSNEKSKAEIEQAREAADLFSKMNQIKKELYEILETRNRLGIAKFSLNKKAALREEISASFDNGLRSYIDENKSRTEKIRDLKKAISDLEEIAEMTK